MALFYSETWRHMIHYINVLKQKYALIITYEHNFLDERSVVDMHRFHLAAKFEVSVVTCQA